MGNTNESLQMILLEHENVFLQSFGFVWILMTFCGDVLSVGKLF